MIYYYDYRLSSAWGKLPLVCMGPDIILTFEISKRFMIRCCLPDYASQT